MGDSLRPYIKTTSLFIRDVDRCVTREELKAFLDKLCPPSKGTVVIPTNSSNDILGTAYLNFWSEEEARNCLRKYRFKVILNDYQAKMMLAANDKDMVYGPFSYKFQIIIKNLSEEVDVQMLCDKFEEYGEIFQCKVDYDNWNQYYGQVQYLDAYSVELACQEANGLGWCSARINVEPHHKAYLAKDVEKSKQPPPSSSSQLDFPSLGGTSTSSQALHPITAHRDTASGTSSAGGSTSSNRSPSASVSFGAAALTSAAAAAATPAPPPPRQQQQGAVPPVNFAVQAMQGAVSAPLPTPMPVPVPVPVPLPVPVPAGATPATPRAEPAVVQSAVAAAVPAAAAAPTGPSSPRPGAAAAAGPAGGVLGLPPHLGFLSGAAAAPQLLQQQQSQQQPVVAPVGSLFDLLTGGSGSRSVDRDRDHQKQQQPAASGALPHTGDMHGSVGGTAAAAGGGSAGVRANGIQTPASAPSGAAAAAGGGAKKGCSGSGACSKSVRSSLVGLLSKVENIAEHLCCSLTLERFVDPVVAADGFTYECSAITAWLQNNKTSPMTQEILPNRVLLPNNLIKSLVEELLG